MAIFSTLLFYLMIFKSKILILFVGILFFFTGFQNAKGDKDKKDFPKPEGIKHLLFYVQRTVNINTLIYELNMTDKDELNVKDPIKTYWINYVNGGGKEPLNYIQRKYAYGIDVKLIDPEKKSYVFNFVSYKKKQLFLIKSPTDGKYYAFINLNNKLLTLSKVWIQIEGGAFWTPKIKYIEVTGRDPAKNEEVIERIIP